MPVVGRARYRAYERVIARRRVIVKRGGTTDAFRPQQLLLGTEGFLLAIKTALLKAHGREWTLKDLS